MIGQHPTFSPVFGRRQEKERKGEGKEDKGCSSTFLQEQDQAHLGHALCPFPIFPAAPLHTNQSSPLLPGEKHRKTTKIFCNWQRGKIKQEKRCVVNTCVQYDRGSLCFIFQILKNKVKSKLILPPLVLILSHHQDRGSNCFKIATGLYNYSKKNQKLNTTAGSKACELAAVKHEGFFCFILAHTFPRRI